MRVRGSRPRHGLVNGDEDVAAGDLISHKISVLWPWRVLQTAATPMAPVPVPVPIASLICDIPTSCAADYRDYRSPSLPSASPPLVAAAVQKPPF